MKGEKEIRGNDDKDRKLTTAKEMRPEKPLPSTSTSTHCERKNSSVCFEIGDSRHSYTSMQTENTRVTTSASSVSVRVTGCGAI